MINTQIFYVQPKANLHGIQNHNDSGDVCQIRMILVHLLIYVPGFGRTRKVITFYIAVAKSENGMESSMLIPSSLMPRPPRAWV